MKVKAMAWAAAAAALVLAGCGSSLRADFDDTAVDTPVDTPVDTAVDTGMDGTDTEVPVDTAIDTGGDGDDPDLPPVGCSNDADCVPYEDGNPCNGTLVCSYYSGLCEVDPSTIVTCPPTASVCDQRVCNAETGICDHVLAEPGTPCEEEGNPCTEDVCDALGHCGHPPVSCDDGDACTADWCDPGEGCVHVAEMCDDANPCTIDHCSADGGCWFEYGTGPCEDGDPCTAPDHCDGAGDCVPGTPVPIWYLDGDGDGFGDPGAIQCANARPAGYVADSTDCCDAMADVNPAQAGWFARGYICPGSGSTYETFDYDCDGYEEQRWEDMGYCSTSSGGCIAVPGWDFWLWAPWCGESETWISACGWSGGSCVTTASSTRTQECR